MILNKIKKLKQIRFIQDVAILQVGSIVGTGLSMISSIIFARVLGPSTYGTYSLVFAFVGLVGLFMDWGAGYGALTLLAEAHARQDKQEVKNVIIYFFKISFFSTIIIGLIAAILAPWITNLAYQEPHIGYLARFVILASVVRLFYALIIAILQVLRKMKKLTILENVNKIFYTLIPVAFVLLGMGVFGIVLGYFITALLFLIFSLVLYIILSKRNSLFPTLREIATDLFKVKIKKYFIFGFAIAIDKNIGSLYTTLPLIIAGAFVATQDIAFFKIAWGLIGMSGILLGPISRLLNVQLPQSKAQGTENLKKAFWRSSLGSLLISIPITIVMVVLAKPVIVLFYGQEFAPSVNFVYILAVHLLVSGLSVGAGPMYRTLNKMKVTISINAALIIVGSPIFYWLIKTYTATGLALSYVIWQGIANLLAVFVLSRIMKKI